MKNVKVILISAVLCTAIFANQRIAALGGDAGFWSGDRANVGIFPATINDHAFVELDGVGSNDGVDASILWGDATKWGFNFDQNDENTWFNISWGNGDMGLNVGYVNNDTGGTDDPTGFAVAYGQNFDWGELGVGFNSGGSDAGAWNNDHSSYWANWRGDMDAWVFDSAKASFYSSDDGNDGTGMALGFDMFTHLDAGGADVLFGLGVDYNSWDNGAASGSSMTLPSATIAVEADMTDWATFRCFVNTDYTVSSSNDGSGDYSDDGYTGASTNYGLGLGFNWGGLTADMSISENVLQDPVSNMTGYEGDALTSGGVTLTYSF